MEFRPVFKDKDAMPVWEITGVVIPEIFEEVLCTESDWESANKVYKTHGNHNDGKFIYSGNALQEVDYTKIMNPVVDFLKIQEDYDFRSSWSAWKFIDAIEAHRDCRKMDIWKMLANADHGAHTDNLFIMGTVILNIAENAEGSGTKYYDKLGPKTNGFLRELYESPAKKGTGVLHINTHSTLHRGHNNSEQDRYVAYTNLMSSGGQK